MKKIFLSTAAFIVGFVSMTSLAHAAPFCEQKVQSAWPSWIGQPVCASQGQAVPARQELSVPDIPEYYQSLMYKRLLTQPAMQQSDSSVSSQAERAGTQWWPDWIDKPLWY